MHDQKRKNRGRRALSNRRKLFTGETINLWNNKLSRAEFQVGICGNKVGFVFGLNGQTDPTKRRTFCKAEYTGLKYYGLTV